MPSINPLHNSLNLFCEVLACDLRDRYRSHNTCIIEVNWLFLASLRVYRISVPGELFGSLGNVISYDISDEALSLSVGGDTTNLLQEVFRTLLGEIESYSPPVRREPPALHTYPRWWPAVENPVQVAQRRSLRCREDIPLIPLPT